MTPAWPTDTGEPAVSARATTRRTSSTSQSSVSPSLATLAWWFAKEHTRRPSRCLRGACHDPPPQVPSSNVGACRPSRSRKHGAPSHSRLVSRQVLHVRDAAPPWSGTSDSTVPHRNASDVLPELLTVAQAAKWLGLSRSTLYQALADHRIAVTPVDLGGRIRLSRRQLERWLEGPSVDASASPQPTPVVPLAGVSSVYDDVFRELAPAAGPRRSPTRSADARSSSASACA